MNFPPLPTAKCYFCSWSKANQPIMDSSELTAYTAQNSALVNTALRVTGVAIHTVAINGPNTSHTVACAHSIIIPILRKMFSITIKFKGLHPMCDIEIKKGGIYSPLFQPVTLLACSTYPRTHQLNQVVSQVETDPFQHCWPLLQALAEVFPSIWATYH